MARLAPLLPFARAPDVKDLLELMDISWFGPPHSTPNSPNYIFNGTMDPPPEPSLSQYANPEEAAYRRQTSEETSPPRRTTRPARQAQRQQVQVYEKLEDGLGTWADRQQVFSQAVQMDEWDSEAAARQAGNQPETPDDGYNAGTASALGHLMESSEDADMNAAWRWRFTRKWQQEQTRQLEGVVSAGAGDDDDWSTALDYMATAAGGLNLQFGRTTSLDHDHSSSLSLDPSLSQTMLLLDASNPRENLQGNGTPGPTDTPMATRRIHQAVRKAEELMAHQAEIERQVAERWEITDAQQPWAAQRIPAVTIDSWGSFPFILARVMDLASGRQKLLVRGRNRFSVKQVTEALDQEVMMEATSRKLPAPRMDLLGSGKIEWSRERDRCVTILGATVHSTLDTRLRRKEDVGRVAGALVRTGLTALHTVNIENAHQAAQGTSSTRQ